MSRTAMMPLVVLMIAVFAGSVSAQAQDAPKAGMVAYGLSIFLGFGTGHYYLGANGTPFLIGDVAGIATMGAGAVYMMASAFSFASSASSSSTVLSTVTTGYVIVGIGGLIFAVSRIWEIVDIFGVAETLRKDGKVAELRPVFGLRPEGASFELSYSY